ncbi:MAG: hypothetical protein SGI77_08995 [Pirellulaceae bacterium]|nr:hypothetical protein [Pirellulaceae bacterium]
MRLSDILNNSGDKGDLNKLWRETEAAGEMGPLPAGEYVTHIVGGELESSRRNETPGYKLTFKVIEGEFKGRLFWHDCWLTSAALPQTKRDLGKLGVTSLEQLEKPLPRFIRCKCKLGLRKDDDGNERNRVKTFEVIGIDAPESDTFAPAATPPTEPAPTASTATETNATEATNEGDGDVFREQLNATGSTRNYTGVCWSRWLWFDIDRDEIDNATADARRLASNLTERYGIAGDELLLFYSGSKGFHIGLPTSLWNPMPSALFHAYCRQFAESVATVSSVAIDSGVYDRVRAFRAPNSKHSKTSRYKRFLTLDELLNLKASRIIELAAEPIPFELPMAPRLNSQAVRDWQAAIASVESQQAVATDKRQSGSMPSGLNRSTLEFIRDGATNGDRHRLLFSTAANLAEFGCSMELALALLSESALDSGLSPSEVRRQIECGLKHNRDRNYQPAGFVISPPEPSEMEDGN